MSRINRRHSLLLVVGLLAGCASKPALSTQQDILTQAAKQTGASDLHISHREDGGLLLNGELRGHPFALAFPPQWNHQTALFANGYGSPGSPYIVSTDPMAGAGAAVVNPAYAQGFVVGDISYDRSGLSFESGVANTYLLKQFVSGLGSTRVYIVGGSMGGNIALALVGKYPRDFAGALSYCGVVGDWPHEIGYLSDTRAAYNYFTRGTAYALPGDPRLEKSALFGLPEYAFKPITAQTLSSQMKQLGDPVSKLYAAAWANPQGPEAKIIDNILAVSGSDVTVKGDRYRDPASISVPLLLGAYGMDDFIATFNGSTYDSTAKIYASPHLSRAANVALNAGIQRIRAEPWAVRKAAAWAALNEHIEVKVLSVYNAIDPLVSSTINEPQLRRVMEQAGRADNLVQREVPAMLAQGDMTWGQPGYTHCGFTPAQLDKAWNDLRTWVEAGQKPSP